MREQIGDGKDARKRQRKHGKERLNQQRVRKHREAPLRVAVQQQPEGGQQQEDRNRLPLPPDGREEDRGGVEDEGGGGDQADAAVAQPAGEQVEHQRDAGVGQGGDEFEQDQKGGLV